MTSRSLTLHDMCNALITLRDKVITDQNLSTLKSVVQKMTQLLIELSNGLTHEDIQSLESEFTSRGLQEEFSLLQTLMDHPFIQSLRTTKTQISIQGIIEAATFIQSHIKTTASIIDDIKELLQALADVTLFTTQSPDDISSRSLDDGTLLTPELQQLYDEFMS